MKKFKKVDSKIDFISMELEVLDKWEKEQTFKKLIDKNKGNKKWSFLDGPITANNPMGVHHAWGRTLKDVYQRYHAMKGFELRYQNGFDCQGLWVEVEVEKELGFKTKKDIEKFGIEKFINICKSRVEKYSKIQTLQSKRLGYWMDWDNSYYTMSDENNFAIWGFLKKLFEQGKIYKGSDVVPWSGKSGTSYSQMEIIEGRKLVAHKSVFVRFPLKDREKEFLLVWTTTPWTLTSNVACAVNVNIEYVKVQSNNGDIYYFAKENLDYKRLEKQFHDKKMWIKDVPKLKTISQIFKEKGSYNIIGTIKGNEMIGWEYEGPFDELNAQSEFGGYPYKKGDLEDKKINAKSCHKIIDGGKDNIGNDIVVVGEGTGIVHIAPGCGSIDNKLGNKLGLVNISPLDEEARFIDGFDWLEGKKATDSKTINDVIENIKSKNLLVYVENYPHIYPHCWRSGDELVYRIVDEWYINMDWRDDIKKVIKDINWIPNWGYDREREWLENMGDWMISKKRFWGLALPIWEFDDGTFYVVGSKEELKELSIEGWDEFKGNSPHRPWIDKVKIKHPETGLIGKRVEDVGNPWLDAGIVPYSTLNYYNNRKYWENWFPADLVIECFPGQFRNWFYSLLAMSTIMESKAPFKTLLGHALVKDENGREMHKSWGNAIWFDDAAEKMGVDVMRWLYSGQNPEQNLLFGYKKADEVRKDLITLWNTYSFFTTYAIIDGINPETINSINLDKSNYSNIDKWLISYVNIIIKEFDAYYKNHEIQKLVNSSAKFLDLLSNWYVRLNRRRFWKSDNDLDKQAAYTTLYYALFNYIKIMSPVIPFITEKIYENLIDKNESKSSIHLEDFPKFDLSLIDQNLVDSMETVIEIVSLGRSARNKGNIKIRQPLSEVLIYSTSENLHKIIEEYSKIIKSELNVKSISIIEDVNKVIEYTIKPNFIIIKEKFKDNQKKIIDFINKLEDHNQIVDDLNNNKNIVVNNQISISKDDLLIESKDLGDYFCSQSKKIVVSINSKINDDLFYEGITRDLIRHIQNLRKESLLNVDDRIKLIVDLPIDLREGLLRNKQYLLNEVLGLEIIFSKELFDENKKIKINDYEFTISIQKVSFEDEEVKK